jgi:tetratricopeptide (TPR) repeat protein
MSDEAGFRFDINALEALAGSRVFARGQAYSRDGRVQIMTIDQTSIRARVTGSQDYRVELTGQGTNVGGTCTCPAVEHQLFCKHMVATALAVNEAGASAEDSTGLARIREYLETRPAGELVGIILHRAENDPALLRRLEFATLSLDADSKRLNSALRKAIDAATRTRGFIDYGEAGGWATGVAEALDQLAGIAETRHAALALGLAEHAVERIEKAIEDIDDSDGHCCDLMARAQAIHLAAARSARPDPVSLAHDLFTRETEGEYDTFYGAVVLYADVLGEEGLAEYRRLAAAAWEQLPPRTSRDRAAVVGDYSVLATILDFFAERDGDVEARIALRAKDLLSPWQYVQLAEFCLAMGREAEALRRAEEGLWIFEDDRPDERLVLFAVDLLVKSGRSDAAHAHLSRTFEKAPSFTLYTRLRLVGGAAARKRAIEFLEAKAVRERRTSWHYPADLLIEILTSEEEFDEAWLAARRHGASAGLIGKLARASEATHPDEALEAYAQRVDQLAELGGNRAYADAAGLIERMARLRAAPEQAAYIAELKLRFARKRNFMKLLA